MDKTQKKRELLVGTIREQRGSRKSQELRAAGGVPAVIYGLNKQNVAITLDAPAAEKAIHSGAHLLDVEVQGAVEHVLIQDVQYNHLQSVIEHVDLLRIDPTHKVRVKVPLEFRGTAKGTKEGGILERQISEVEIEVLPLHIPDLIRVNVDHLELHQILHVRDIAVPEGARIINHPEQIVVQVRTVKEQVATEVATGPAEPEVIGKKPAEEGEGDAAAGKPTAGGKAAPAAGAAKK